MIPPSLIFTPLLPTTISSAQWPRVKAMIPLGRTARLAPTHGIVAMGNSRGDWTLAPRLTNGSPGPAGDLRLERVEMAGGNQLNMRLWHL